MLATGAAPLEENQQDRDLKQHRLAKVCQEFQEEMVRALFCLRPSSNRSLSKFCSVFSNNNVLQRFLFAVFVTFPSLPKVAINLFTQVVMEEMLHCAVSCRKIPEVFVENLCTYIVHLTSAR
jgi:hypothetical protein